MRQTEWMRGGERDIYICVSSAQETYHYLSINHSLYNSPNHDMPTDGGQRRRHFPSSPRDEEEEEEEEKVRVYCTVLYCTVL